MAPELELKIISVDDIHEPANQPRTVIVAEKLQELADSIKLKGVIQPIIVIQKGDKYELDAGQRRLMAARMAGLAVIPCIVKVIDEKGADFDRLHENYCREDINPVDEGKYFLQMKEKYDMTFADIAKICCKSESYVVSRVSLLQEDPRILAALEAGQINFSQALEINRAHDEGVIGELLRVTIESGATVESLRIMRHDYGQRARSQELVPVGSSPGPASYAEQKHLIVCPCCKEAHPVNKIYPISVCVTCHGGLLEGLKGEK